MSEMVAVTIGIGRWAQLAAKTARLASRCTDLRVQILGDRELGATGLTSPELLKLRLFDLIAAEHILYFDPDVAFVREWEPEVYAGRRELVCVRDSQWDARVAEYARAFEVPAETYFGAKLFIANRANHGDWLRSADACRYELAGPPSVAALLNAAAARLRLALHFLDHRYDLELSPGSKLWSRVGAVAVHAGAGGETMLERIVDEHTSVDRTPRSRSPQSELAVADRFFWQHRENGRRRLLRLQADGTVTGGTTRERLWFVEGDGAERRLLLADESNVTCELLRSGSTWRGHSTCAAAEGGRLVVLEPARGERLADLLRSTGREPREGLIIGGAEGLTCSILLERFPKLSLRILLAGVRGTDRADARADLGDATRPWAARRFIIDAPCSDAALSAVPEQPLDFAYFATADGIPPEAAPAWLSRLAVDSLIVGECSDATGEQSQTPLRRMAESLAGMCAEEDGIWWCRTTRVIPSPQPSTPRRWVGPSEVTEATAADVAADFLRNVSPYPTDRFRGQGIVTCAGGTRYLPCAWVCIQMLRRLGCTLPVELWSLGPAEIDADIIRLFEPLGVRCVDASGVAERHPVRILNGWELKPFSILHSAFEEVLFLDADNVPARDPADLFESAEYRRTGAIFWPDFGRLGPQRAIWDVCRVPYLDEPEFETGQIVVDKSRCWRALQLTMHLNEYSDFYYRHVHGDKETFHMAWRMLRQEYSMVPWPIHALRGVMCQHDFDGRRLFQHRNLAKWELEGPNQHIPGFEHEDECLRFLEDLRRRWDGRIGHGRPATAAEYDAGRELVRVGRFRYVRVGHDSRRIEFQDGGRVGEGRAACEEFWYTREGSRGDMGLVIGGRGQATCRLTKSTDGIWRGKWLIGELMAIELVPLANAIPDSLPLRSPLSDDEDRINQNAEDRAPNRQIQQAHTGR